MVLVGEVVSDTSPEWHIVPTWRNVSTDTGRATVPGVTDGMDGMDVRERRHAATRDALLESAIELIDSQGYAGVTVEAIAAAAGVSRRTAYRRFRTKDDILLELPRRWLRIYDEALAAHPDVVGRDAVETASLALSAYIDAHRRETLVGLAALADSPTLASTTVAHDAWPRRVVDVLVADGWDAVDAQLVAGAYLGGIDSMLAVWATDPDRGPLVEVNRRLHERLRSIWGD